MPTKADYVEADLGTTETTETDLGDITISGKASGRIIGVWGVVEANPTTDEAAVAYFRLASDDIDISPAKFPAAVFYGNTGTVAGGSASYVPRVIPVDIQASPLAKIGCYMVMSGALTDGAHGAVGLIYE